LAIAHLESALTDTSAEKPQAQLFFSFNADVGILIRKLRELYQDGEAVDLTLFDAYTVAGLLLTFFKELPEPLLQFATEPIHEEENSLKRLDMIKVR